MRTKQQFLSRRFPFLVSGLIALVLIGSFHRASVEAGQSSSRWVTFAPPRGGFTIQMPAQPSKSDEHEQDTGKGKVKLHFFMLSTDSGFYGVGWADYPFAPEVKGELDANRDNFLKEVKGKLLSETEITLKGHPGREFAAEGTESGVFFRSRIYLNGNRVYQTVTGCIPARANAADVARFLDSFDLPPTLSQVK